MSYKKELRNIIDVYVSDYKKASEMLYSIKNGKEYTEIYKNEFSESWLEKFNLRSVKFRKDIQLLFDRKYSSMRNNKMAFVNQYKESTHLRINNYVKLIQMRGTSTEPSTIDFILREFKNDPITFELLLGALKDGGYDENFIHLVYLSSPVYVYNQTMEYNKQIQKYLNRLSLNFNDLEFAAEFDDLAISSFDLLNDNLDYILPEDEQEEYNLELEKALYQVFKGEYNKVKQFKVDILTSHNQTD